MWRDVTYGRVVVDYRPEKSDPYRTRLTVGGDRVNYLGYYGTHTADLIAVKLLLSSLVLTPDAKFMTISVKDFYLNTPMARRNYMHLKLSDLTESVVQQYKLESKATKDGYAHVEIRCGVYGLPHAGPIAQQLLEKQLNKKGYKQIEITPGLGTQEWSPISLSLCMDDFGLKYFGRQHPDHLMSFLKEHYKIYHDWKSKRYLGLDIGWDHDNRKVHPSMLAYIAEALTRFEHKHPRKPQDQPFPAH